MKIFMDLGLSALFLHRMHAIYIQMSQSRYVKFENHDMSKLSQLLRPNDLQDFFSTVNTDMSFDDLDVQHYIDCK